MTKAQINKELKELGLGFVKMLDKGNCFDKEVCYTNFEGKRVKGFKASSKGPMTVINAHIDKVDTKIFEIENSLRELGMVRQDNLFISPNGKIKLSISVMEFPTYTDKMGYDSDYKTLYVVPTYTK